MKYGDPDKVRVCHISSINVTLRSFLLGLLRDLNRSGCETYAVSSPCDKASEIEDAGVHFYPVQITRSITPLLDLFSLWKLYHFLRREKIHILQTHTPKPMFLGPIAARLAGVPVVVTTIHGSLLNINTPHFKKILWVLYHKFIEILSDFTITVNKEDASFMVREGICDKRKIEALKGGVGRNLDLFSPQRFIPEFIKNKKQGLGIPSGCLVIGIVARIIQSKGYFELFEAFSIVKKKFPDTVLLVVGGVDWERKDRITPQAAKESGIMDGILFLEERTDVPELYAVMDIFVLPSYREGFPATVMEASAMGKAIIATDVTGCREAVEDGKTGLLVPPRDPKALATALFRLLNSSELRQKLAAGARQKALRDFDEKDFFKIQKEIYQKLIEKKIENKVLC